jgi:hypothetical protein
VYLQRALRFSDDDKEVWRRGLAALLGPASHGVWPVEARLLFDLQKICVDHERPVYAADLVEWVVSFGKKPVKRLLPFQGDVQAVRQLRKTLGRLASARIDQAIRREMGTRLQHALHHAEHHLRERLRPEIMKTLDAVRLKPAGAAETVARDKLVEELLDRVVERGFLNLGDLRDAIARNRLKMPDLSSPKELVLGDPLIRANRRLAESLDGVYHRGEIYLRWLQRLTSVAFATRVGRFFSRYFALPFGCAYVALEGVQEILKIGMEFTGLLPRPHEVNGEEVHPHMPFHLAQWWSVGLLGVFLLGMLYWPRFRRAVVRGLSAAVRAGRALIDLPSVLFEVPFVRAFFQSRPYLIFYQYLAKPLFYTVPVSAALYYFDAGWAVSLCAGGGTFLAMTLLFNSAFGLRLEEAATDRLVRAWHLLSVDWLPGLLRAVWFLFKRLLEGVEVVIYTVDEWLRFRQGDSPASFYVKVVLGLVWFCVAYVVRFALNLLVEPQINPIKHFPVVTVSHKMLLPLVVPAGKNQPSPLGGILMTLFHMENVHRANTIAVSIQVSIPGIFGFLVWELKENWKLYRANQSPTLDAEMVGSHGETVLRLLHPGFHSGTLPKLYAKLRRAKGKSLYKQTEALHHVAEALRHFVERTLLATLAGSRRWGLGGALRVAAVHCGCNRIRIELSCEPLPGESLLVDLEDHAGWLVAGIGRRGWLAALSAEQYEAWSAALAGFYKRAGVDVVREQVAALLPPATTFTITETGLVVWLGDSEVRYDLGEAEALVPVAVRGPASLPTLNRKDVLFSETGLRWADWVETWERDRLAATQPAGAFTASN